MIFRRAKRDHSTSDLDARDRRRRGKEPDPESEPASHDADADADTDSTTRPLGEGPYDADEIGRSAGAGDVDMGSLVLRPHPGTELRLQLDPDSQVVLAVMLVTETSGMELRAFAAPRTGTLWPDVRREMAAEATRRGGVADEGRGTFGAEVKVSVPATAEDGTKGTQVTRIVGIDGPRWFIRATFFGKAAEDPTADTVLEQALCDAIVVRGKQPMAPRDMLPLSLPADATPVQEAASSSDAAPSDAG